MEYEKEPWGQANPARTHAEVRRRGREWASTEMFMLVHVYEVLGWTEQEYAEFNKTQAIPERVLALPPYKPET